MKRRSQGFRLLTLALAAALMTCSVLAQTSLSPYLNGWALLSSNHALAAAEAWAVAAGPADRRSSITAKREAAFGHVLAAIAYEQAGDARSYVRWGDAVRLYREAGLTWELDREALRVRWRTLEHALAQAADGTQPALGRDDQLLADLVQRVHLLDYNGPRAGLSDARDGASDLNNITPQYFAGAGETEAGMDVALPQSRYGEGASGVIAELPPALRDARGGPDAATSSPVAALPMPSVLGASDLADAPAPTVVSITARLQRNVAAAGDSVTAEQSSSALARRSTGLPRQFQATTRGPLTNAERARAQRAWRYVLANRQSSTGLVNGKDAYPVSSVADIAQTIAAYVCALSLQLIEREGFETDMRQLLATLRELPLYNQELFNREYDSRSGRMLGLDARSSPTGSGWSAEDIGRLLLWLRVLGNTTSDLAPATQTVVARLRMSRLVDGGNLHSALNQDNHEQIVDDLRLGRQQVTAAALSLWGVVLPAMFGYDDALIRRVGTVAAPADRRDGGSVSPDVFARGIIEFGGIDGCFEAAARAMLDAQHGLAAARGQPVMVADELLDRSPWFVYGALAMSSEPWRVASFDQQSRADLATFSLKAAYLWAAIDKSPRTTSARALADSFGQSERGLYGGRYLDGSMNLALTLDTNASVLLAAHYAQRGGQPMLRVDNPADYACPDLQAAVR